ncbi:MAG: S41 family peptidase [Marinifilaceae bacterium]|jgi:Tol biopolymer transport system component|nr:S41 family peptidase [Marinifilaceae bacterium]
MKKISLLVLIFFFSLSVFAKATNEWIRYAAISPDGEKIVFTKKGDLFIVSSKGGEAKALTNHEAHDYMPVWSKDGKKIAFASNRHGNFDVYIVDAKGGTPKRLTFHSANEYPYTFANNNKDVIFGAQRLDDVKQRQCAKSYLPELYSVPVKGGIVDQIFSVPAESVQVNRKGNILLYQDKKGGEDEFRKHHTSAITRDIWKYDMKTKKHTKLTTFNGEDRNPIFSNDEKSVYYLSEQAGNFNVFKFSINTPTKAKQITNFKKHPVRYLSLAKNGTLCYTHNGDLYIKTAKGSQKRLKVTINEEDKENYQRFASVRGNVSEMAISPNGKEVVYVVRGEVFVSAVKGHYTKRITNTPEQEQEVSFSPDGKKIIYSSERNGKWGIYSTEKVYEKEPYFYASTVLKEKPLIVNKTENYNPKFSPDGKEIAYIANKRNLKVYNLKSKKSRQIIGGEKLFYMSDGDQYFAWSPDSKWLLLNYSPVLANSEVVLLQVRGGKKFVNLTESGYGDYSPKFVNGGKQILWCSDRHGMRSYANSGSRTLDVYSIFLTNDAWDRYRMSEDDYKLFKELESIEKKEAAKKKAKADKKKKKKKKKSKKDKKKAKVKSLKIDWNGISDRKARLTVNSSRIADAVLSKDGEKLYYLANLGKGYDLWQVNLRTSESKLLIPLRARSGQLMWDKKMKTLFLLSSGRISTVNLMSRRTKSISINSEMKLDEKAERRNMFEHVWQRNKQMFYTRTFHGIDWDEMKKNYEPKLESIGNNFEFAQLLSEMLGELNVSHCGARYYGSFYKGDSTASLGIFFDYNYKGNGIKITEIIKGGPLDKDRFNLHKGMIITAINGVKIKRDKDIAVYLNRIAGDYTLLTIKDPKTKKSQNIRMKPISRRYESALLYRRWVKQNEADVKRLSNGTLAYVHVPGMNDGAYRNVYEKVMGKYYNAKGLVVDTRFNGGGDLVADLTMFLTGEHFIEYAIDSRDIGQEPSYRWTKPSVAMANEANYSDGSCFSCAYQELGIGKLIGMPVPGTCSFAGWEMLQSGDVLWGSIPVSAKNKAGEWMENNQTVPDVQVKNMPGVIDQGKDKQLEVAVKELLKDVKKNSRK